MHPTPRNHSHGGCPSQNSSPLGCSQLGHTGSIDPALCSSHSRPRVADPFHSCSPTCACPGSSKVVPGKTDIWAASVNTTVYTPIPPDGCVMIPKIQYPTSQTDICGSANHPIFLSNDTDSGISSFGHLTLDKATGTSCQVQHLTSTPKSKPKLLSAAQHQTTELAAKRQGAPHGAHMKSDHSGTAQANSWGTELQGWHPSIGIREGSMDSSIVSLDNHSQFTTKHLIERDGPSRNRSIISGGNDIESIHDSSNAEMISNPGLPEQHSKDSSPDSAPEDGEDLDMISTKYPGFGHHSESSSDPECDPRSNVCSGAKSSSENSSNSSTSDRDGYDLGNMFLPKKKAHKPPLKRPESQPQSSSCSRS